MSTRPNLPCSVSELLNFVTTALHNPEEPTLCSGSLTAAIEVLLHGHEDLLNEEDVDVQARNDFCEALYRFLVVRRSPDDLQKWMQGFSQCKAHCPPTTHGSTRRRTSNRGCASNRGRASTHHSVSSTISEYYHREWTDTSGGFIRAQLNFYTYIFRQNVNDRHHLASLSFIVGAFAGLCKVLAGSLSKPFLLGRSKTWPIKVSDLTHTGCNDVVHNILQWYKISPQPYILQFLSLLASHVRYSMHNALAQFKFLPLTVASTMTMVDLVISTLDRKEEPKIERFICESFVLQVMAFFDVIAAFEEYFIPADVKLRFMDGCATQVVQLCTLTHCLFPALTRLMKLHKLDMMKEKSLKEFLLQPISAGRKLYREFGVDSVGDVWQSLPIVEKDRELFFGDVSCFEGELGLSSIWHHGFEAGCSSAKCPKGNIFEDPDRTNLKACNRCFGVYYCGSGCQRDDWNDEDHPHRDLCPLIHKVVGACRQLTDMKEGSTKELRMGARMESHLETVVNIQLLINEAKLSSIEVNLLTNWGRRVYRAHTLDATKMGWHPGYPDYDSILDHLATQRIYQGVIVGLCTKTPTPETEREKRRLAIYQTEPEAPAERSDPRA